MAGDVRIVSEADQGRIIVVDSVTHCNASIAPTDVIVAGSFAGAISLGFLPEGGVRALVAHEAGPGKDAAGISGLAVADTLGLPAAAVATMSARLGDGTSVFTDGVIAHANVIAKHLGVRVGMTAADAVRVLLDAPPGRRLVRGSIDRRQRIVCETAHGRIVLVGSTSFATAANRHDVLCAGSHGGRVNTRPLLTVQPRGVITSDGGMARERSGADGLPVLEAAGITAATVDGASSRIGDPESLWQTGTISAVNELAARAGVKLGQPAREAARLMLDRSRPPGS